MYECATFYPPPYPPRWAGIRAGHTGARTGLSPCLREQDTDAGLVGASIACLSLKHMQHVQVAIKSHKLHQEPERLQPPITVVSNLKEERLISGHCSVLGQLAPLFVG